MTFGIGETIIGVHLWMKEFYYFNIGRLLVDGVVLRKLEVCDYDSGDVFCVLDDPGDHFGSC